jgi:hypothetical protein
MVAEYQVWIYSDNRTIVYQGPDHEKAARIFRQLHKALQNDHRHQYGIEKRTVTPFVSIAHTLL